MKWPHIFWRDRFEEVTLEMISTLKAEIERLHMLRATDMERIDRLVEALARKANIDIVMPQPPPVPIERTITHNPWKDPNLVTGNFNLQESKKQ